MVTLKCKHLALYVNKYLYVQLTLTDSLYEMICLHGGIHSFEMYDNNYILAHSNSLLRHNQNTNLSMVVCTV